MSNNFLQENHSNLSKLCVSYDMNNFYPCFEKPAIKIRKCCCCCCCCCLVASVVSDSLCRLCADSVRHHRRQPIRLPHPWDSPGKNNGVGCHFLLQYMKVKSESEVAQSCLTVSDPMDCSLPGSSVHRFSRREYWSGVPLPSLTASLRR